MVLHAFAADEIKNKALGFMTNYFEREVFFCIANNVLHADVHHELVSRPIAP